MVCVIIFVCDVSQATTPEAWAAHQREVMAACLAASRLRNARAARELIEFDDRVGYSAIVIERPLPAAAHEEQASSHALPVRQERPRGLCFACGFARVDPASMSAAGPPKTAGLRAASGAAQRR
jgi:hypothetical protein